MAQCVMVSNNMLQYIAAMEYLLCVDINECEYSISPCEDVCTNTEGSYTCSCSDHHERVTEDGRCVGK